MPLAYACWGSDWIGERHGAVLDPERQRKASRRRKKKKPRRRVQTGRVQVSNGLSETTSTPPEVCGSGDHSTEGSGTGRLLPVGGNSIKRNAKAFSPSRQFEHHRDENTDVALLDDACIRKRSL